MPTPTFLLLVRPEQEEGGAFGPDEIAIITTAFNPILRDYKLVQRDDRVGEMLAWLVIKLVRNGERDPKKLRKQVLGTYWPP